MYPGIWLRKKIQPIVDELGIPFAEDDSSVDTGNDEP
jgi:hypothetical protein